MNLVQAYVPYYEALLNKFPEAHRSKLRMYTLQELFYVYKLATHKVQPNTNTGDIKGSDVFCAALRTRLFSWLKGDMNEWATPTKPIPATSLNKLASKYRKDWSAYITFIEMDRNKKDVAIAKEKAEIPEFIKTFASAFNNKRTA